MYEALKFYIEAEDSLDATDDFQSAADYTAAMAKFDLMARAALAKAAPHD